MGVSLLWLAIFTPVDAIADVSPAMQQRIVERVRQQPENASAWRMLGRVQIQNGDQPGAIESLRTSLKLDPLNAAAHHDLAVLLMELGRDDQAIVHFERAVQLAPESEYANAARQYLQWWGIETLSDDEPEIRIVSHEAGAFDGEERFESSEDSLMRSLSTPDDAFDLTIDIGMRYNSNVALAPTSRQLVPGNRQSFQLSISPDAEWTLGRGETSRWGINYFGEWTFNENHFREFNLQSYQPGVFWETEYENSGTLYVPRIEYGFIHDEFDGTTFANRHQVTASLLTMWDSPEASYLYWSSDVTEFLQDGSNPALTSQDGWNHTLGGSHRWFWSGEFLRSISVGVDLQRAETRGANFRFNGVQLFSQAKFVPADDWECRLSAGVGYRDYFDFVGSPSRDEFNWRTGLEIERRFTDVFSITLLAKYQAFDSRNPQFDADRFLGGVVSTFRF